MLAMSESLFLRRGDHDAVANEAGGRVVINGVDPERVHAETPTETNESRSVLRCRDRNSSFQRWERQRPGFPCGDVTEKLERRVHDLLGPDEAETVVVSLGADALVAVAARDVVVEHPMG